MQHSALVNSILSIAVSDLEKAQNAALLDVQAGTALDKADAESAAQLARLARQALLGSLDLVMVEHIEIVEDRVIIRRGGLFDTQPSGLVAMEEW